MESKVAGALLHCVYDGSISMFDMEIERRPYHKNCTCALHKSNKNCSNLCPQRRKTSVLIKQLWKECSLSMDGNLYSKNASSSVASSRVDTTHMGTFCMDGSKSTKRL
ncbi:hypothetical protein FRX31_030377 [Thalictrum thalictroides]|uniref:Uncharacterized protein n=1 Tax=Thalictrum thalictroides TaxID=46969 RepID=A0A7J6V544_THATH|nr:hypothetical protein FRX31_030377 [Thalictrum thalictroides]